MLTDVEIRQNDLRSASGDGELDIPAIEEAAGTVVGWHEMQRTGKPNLTFGAVLFEGVLRVTDAAAFRAALERGIGSGKAYGFGLLSVAPARG